MTRHLRISTAAARDSSYALSEPGGDLKAEFLVTNRHVLEDDNGDMASEVSLTMIPRTISDNTPSLGNAVTIDITNVGDFFTFHPDPSVDIAAAPLKPIISDYEGRNGNLFYYSIGRDSAPSEEDMNDLDAIEDVTFVGYPNGLFDTYNKTPIARQGVTATPIHWPWGGKHKFLIDASVFSGSSGSPVFIVQRNGFNQGGSFMVGQTRVLFMGILAATLLHDADVDRVALKKAISDVRETIDLGIVYRWELVEETVQAAFSRHNLRWR